MNRERTFDATGTAVVPSFPTSSDLDRHLARAQRLRAEATAAMLASAFRGSARPVRSLLARVARWQERRRTYDALMRCSDRVLADIGIEREDIPLIAKGIDPRQHERSAPAMWRWWAAARVRLDADREARRERRRVYRELMTYKDHELDDLGVRRSDIAGIARGEPVLRKAA